MSPVVLLTRRLYALGYSPPLDGRGGVLHCGNGTSGDRFRELSAALTKRCLYRDAAALIVLAESVEATGRRDLTAMEDASGRLAALLSRVS